MAASASAISETCPSPADSKVREQRRQESFAGLAPGRRGLPADADPRLDERPDQPRPHGALVIHGVARRRSRLRIARRSPARQAPAIAGRSASEAALDGIDDAPSALAVEQRERQSAHGKDLIRPNESSRVPGS